MKYIAACMATVGLLGWGIVSGGRPHVEEVTLRDKIGQMLIIGFEGKAVTADSPIAKAIEQGQVGGVILFDYHYQTQTFDKNIESPQQVRELNQQLQYMNHLANHAHHRPDLPLLISVDYEGGKAATRLRENHGFPATISAATAGKMNPSEVKHVAQTMGETLRDAGFNLNFAPVLDVNVNPENPVMGALERSFSSDPQVVADYASLYSQQWLDQGLQCAYKHFPGHGSSRSDSHLGFVDVTDTWNADELKPFQQLLGGHSGCGMVMTAHIVNRQLDVTGLPATLSYPIITGLLRQQLHFDGVIITDDMQMKAISAHYGVEQALVLAINAGADMFIFGNQLTDTPQDPIDAIDLIEANVRSGEISEARIDEAYRHILEFKRSIHVNKIK